MLHLICSVEVLEIFYLNMKCRYSWYKHIHYIKHSIKDARSVSLYPYNRSQILQYVKYTKQINVSKEIANFCDK